MIIIHKAKAVCKQLNGGVQRLDKVHEQKEREDNEELHKFRQLIRKISRILENFYFF